MTKQRVLLGATGETGGSILNGLLVDTESFMRHVSHYPREGSDRALQDVEALVRLVSINKPQVQELAKRGVKIRAVDIGAQLSLATAAKQAGVKRFVPCAFTTVAPPGGVMYLRDTVGPLRRAPAVVPAHSASVVSNR
ncbi:hypothetical protein B0H17DRAFT_1146258 [Mycena rosella]|uniref:NmrA-like domain-containing protein n=1 Tax=Mycena rosella TaxID=1033263 RepID=A0AAD7CPB8_MYCRO|nr:hypothetical protein B0H17DRAFT_1146258 [Mycena rosella]